MVVVLYVINVLGYISSEDINHNHLIVFRTNITDRTDYETDCHSLPYKHYVVH